MDVGVRAAASPWLMLLLPFGDEGELAAVEVVSVRAPNLPDLDGDAGGLLIPNASRIARFAADLLGNPPSGVMDNPLPAAVRSTVLTLPLALGLKLLAAETATAVVPLVVVVAPGPLPSFSCSSSSLNASRVFWTFTEAVYRPFCGLRVPAVAAMSAAVPVSPPSLLVVVVVATAASTAATAAALASAIARGFAEESEARGVWDVCPGSEFFLLGAFMPAKADFFFFA
mmetsp:Transcript_28063/g.47199  ORF Transcript_28063/g.47199 Transcript_28063/m.47199 type:complete len:228 (+) Transcript_28063:1628-2311(+)